MTRLPIADAHVDVLYRMAGRQVAFYGDSPLQASYNRLEQGGVNTQVFALYVYPQGSGGVQLDEVMRQIDCFYEQICSFEPVSAVTSKETLMTAHRDGKLAALLSLEGGGCLGGDPAILRLLFRLGVRGMGLTWNPGNELADGCREARGAGLTSAGKAVIQEMERLGMWIDLAHLADAGVADIFRIVDGPVMASHANARHIHEHPRNLTDDVIREIVRRQGWIGLTFEGAFVSEPSTASISGVFRHLDHLLELGAEDVVGLGSDFDGTSNAVQGLAHAGDYADFAEKLAQRYGEPLARKILFDNFHRFLGLVLPA